MFKTKNNLNIYYQNVRGLRTKQDIKPAISASQIDIIGFTESWLNENFSNSEYFDDSYFVERTDRNISVAQRGGGVILALKSKIPYKRLSEWEEKIPFDNIWVSIDTVTSGKSLFINIVYIPPASQYNSYEKYFDEITDIMIASKPESKFIILGDFNMSGAITWYCNNGICTPLSVEGDIANEFLNTLSITDLRQLNTLKNENNRILDYALTNIDNIELHSIDPLSTLDTHHPPFVLHFNDHNVKFIKSIKTEKYNFFKGNYEMINEHLSQYNWSNMMTSNNVNEQVSTLYNCLWKLIKKFVPCNSPKCDDFPKYFSPKLIEIIRDKNHFHDKYKKTKIELYNIIYKKKEEN